MKKAVLILCTILSVYNLAAQDLGKYSAYKPGDDAGEKIRAAVDEAKASGRHVLIQVGGNWCVWCARFDDFVANDPSLDSLVKANYVLYHLNHSKENKNTNLLKKYSFPQRMGFPVFLVLDSKGNLLHTQSSWYLEAGKSYDKEKVTAFFTDWSPKALDPSQYKEE